jgi:hypothetical protein
LFIKHLLNNLPNRWNSDLPLKGSPDLYRVFYYDIT